ncbi:MAG: hypothetical protein HYU68_04000 [Bacteroidetes bacterium]|nr:hypothetical protein [Bacteroidota bacterium]
MPFKLPLFCLLVFGRSTIGYNLFIGLTKPSLYTQIWVDRSDNHQAYLLSNVDNKTKKITD